MSDYARARRRLLDRGLVTFDANGGLTLTHKGREELADLELLWSLKDPAARENAPRARDEDGRGRAGRRSREATRR